MSAPRVLVTGAGRGIGLALARHWVGAGWVVHACARGVSPALAALQQQAPRQLYLHALDIADFGAIERLADEITEPIDVLLSNAAMTGGELGIFGNTDYLRWADAHRTNAMAPLKLMECFAPHVAGSQRKVMFCISSRLGANPFFGYLGYFASKQALNMVVMQAALALKPQGISVVAAHPGWVQTDGTDGMGRAPLSPDDAARLLAAIVDRVTLADTATFFDPDGSTLPLVTQQTAVKFYSKPLDARR